MKDNLPNVNKSEPLREVISFISVFAVLYLVVILLHAGGGWCKAYEPLFFVVLIGYALQVVAWIMGLAITAVLCFSLLDWWSDLRALRNRGMTQSQLTSGVPFMPGATRH